MTDETRAHWHWPEAIRLKIRLAQQAAAHLRRCSRCGKKRGIVARGAVLPPESRQVVLPPTVHVRPYAFCRACVALGEGDVGRGLEGRC